MELLSEQNFSEVEEEFTQMVEKYKQETQAWLSSVETEMRQDGRELMRKLLHAHISARGVGNVGELLKTTDGKQLTHKRLIKRKLNTLFGPIEIIRTGYTQRNDHFLFPLDSMLNLPPSSFSYGLQRFLARRLAVNSFSEALNLVHEISGIKIGNGQANQIAESCVTDFDQYYENMLQKEDQVMELLVLSTDGKGIVMRPNALTSETQRRAEISKHKMKKRLSRGEKSNYKRMAQVASVYFVERFIRTPQDVLNELRNEKTEKRRPSPSQKRVWASVEKSAKEVIQGLFLEAEKRDPEHKMPWVILIDGNKHQLNVIKTESKKSGCHATIVLDIIHVIEYLWRVARIFLGEAKHSACENWVNEKLCAILNEQAAAVAGSIKMSAAKRKLTKQQKKTVTVCARYISSHKQYMNYKTYLANGFPVATGVIEGACRYLIKDRMDITGARWGLSGAEAVLKLRSLVSSGDFDDYWQFHLKNQYDRNYSSKIAKFEKNLD